MKRRTLLLFIIAILLLGWALGSLSRSQPGGSILVNSFWILYALDALPLLGLGALILLVFLIVLYLKGLSDALGSGIARKLSRKKKTRRYSVLRIMIMLYAWAFVAIFLLTRCNGNGIVCRSNNSLVQNAQRVIVGNSPSSIPSLPSLQAGFGGLTSLVSYGWFFPVFLALLVVCTVTVGRSLIVAFQESKAQTAEEITAARKGALIAVEEALKIVTAPYLVDPRSRIINCYQLLLETCTRYGARLTPQQTARELEHAMRQTFLLHGPAVAGLTGLFEEARYSLHEMSDADARTAQQYLDDIAKELSHEDPVPMLVTAPPA